MKKLCFLAVMLSLLVSGVFAETIGNWVGPTGSFADTSKWSTSYGNPSTWSSTSTGDEVKICVEGCLSTLDSVVVPPSGTFYRITVAAGPTLGATLQIVDGGSYTFGETRVGQRGSAGSGCIGHVIQTGGNVIFRDLIMGIWKATGSSVPIYGSYSVSGGTIGYTTTNGRLWIGGGNGGGYTEGLFTVIGNDADILFKGLYIGSDLTNSGKGTLEFRIDPDGVSPIKVAGVCRIDQAPVSTNSQAHLLLSATGATTPAEDIVLVEVTTLLDTTLGTFDTLNGGSAAEGTEIVLGDNVYKLTYKYAANGTARNDIALVHVANFLDIAHNPVPADGSTVTTLSSLSWVNPDPNEEGGILICDVYFGKGTDPNRVKDMDKKTLGAGVTTVAINSTNFPHYVPLTDKTWYYWIVDVHDTTDPNVAYGIRWKVYTDINVAPYDVNAGDDQVVWLTSGTKTVSLHGTASDDGLPSPPAAINYAWSYVSGPATAVINSPNTADTTVTMIERGTYEFQLAASDTLKTTTDIVQIIVGNNACDASHMMSTSEPYDAGDQNQDCIVDLQDFAALIATQWLCTETDCSI